MHLRITPILSTLVLMLSPMPGLAGQHDTAESDAAETGAAQEERRLPLARDWFEERGIDLPLPLGVSATFIYMTRDIEVTDVRVQFGDRPPESISDRADFDVSNTTFIPAFRFDAWVLPFLNFYLMAGGGTTDTSLRTVVTVDPPLGDPLEIEVVQDERVEGGMLGVGATTVVGGDKWFAMLDANYSKLEVDAFDDGIDAWLYSGRLGWHGQTSWGPARAWGGLMYMESGRTLELSEDFPVIGETRIEVDQQPVDPWTLQFGASVTVNRQWDLLFEVGSNFDDAFVAVASCAYRF